MTRLPFILAALLTCTSAYAQNCNIGNEDSTGFDNLNDPFWKDNLLGTKFVLANSGILHSVNLVGRNTGALVQMAVYTDNAGVPGSLVVSTNTVSVTAGIVSIPVSPTPLLAGEYWVMAIYNINGGHTHNKSSTGNVTYYAGMNFGTPIPADGSGFLNFQGYDYTYFLEISCGVTAIADGSSSAEINLYPNPASDLISAWAGSHCCPSTYAISDLAGRKILTGALTLEITSVDISQLTPGVYFFRVEGAENRLCKLLKK